jgi:hypothetical protein
MAIYNTNFGFESELDALSELSADEAAIFINNIMVENPKSVFGSYRTLAKISTEDEYNALRGIIENLVTGETGYLISDMVDMLKIPGDDYGRGGGLDLTSPTFLSFVSGLCTANGPTGMVEKIQNYTNSFQPIATSKYGFVSPGQIITARQQSTENI